MPFRFSSSISRRRVSAALPPRVLARRPPRYATVLQIVAEHPAVFLLVDDGHYFDAMYSLIVAILSCMAGWSAKGPPFVSLYAVLHTPFVEMFEGSKIGRRVPLGFDERINGCFIRLYFQFTAEEARDERIDYVIEVS